MPTHTRPRIRSGRFSLYGPREGRWRGRGGRRMGEVGREGERRTEEGRGEMRAHPMSQTLGCSPGRLAGLQGGGRKLAKIVARRAESEGWRRLFSTLGFVGGVPSPPQKLAKGMFFCLERCRSLERRKSFSSRGGGGSWRPRRPQEAPGGPRRLQEAPGGARDSKRRFCRGN